MNFFVRVVLWSSWITSRRRNKSKEVSFQAFASQLPRNFLLRVCYEHTNSEYGARTSFKALHALYYLHLTRAISATLDFHTFNCSWRKFSFKLLSSADAASCSLLLMVYIESTIYMIFVEEANWFFGYIRYYGNIAQVL